MNCERRHVLLLLVVWTTHASQAAESPHFLLKGQCPVVTLAEGFNMQQFKGTWYRIGGLPNVEERSVNCTVYNYVTTDAGYIVNSSGLDRAGKPVKQNITLLADTPGMAKFSTRVRTFDAEMVVLNTDYTTYCCLFTCYNFQGSHKAIFAWILSRTSTLKKQEIANCQKELERVGVPLEKLRGTYQGADCNHQ
ncbi:crustacyanin-A1 subunit isoform X2 [Procambarus clarkii]|uniref:crustacyanin-A1 subunit isoform X2 n=1 Tax=Procambarus clarkii TaxID=6728 RepID=UPI003742D155